MSWAGRQKIMTLRSLLTVAAIQSVWVLAAGLPLASSGWAQEKPIHSNAPEPAEPPQAQSSQANSMQLKPATGGIHLTTGSLQMTGWEASTSMNVQLTTGALQMTGWEASTSINVQLTTGQLQMTGSAK